MKECFNYRNGINNIVLVQRDGDTVKTDLFTKDTDSHQYLHFKSCHPFHVKKGIPYGQALRMRRICSSDEAFRGRILDLKEWLCSRGYNKDLVDTQVGRAASLSQEEAFSNSHRGEGPNRDFLVLTFHPALSARIYDIIRSLQVVLQADEEHKRVFQSIPLISFRRSKTLQDILVRAKLPQRSSAPNCCQGCNRRNCQVCKFIDGGETFRNKEGTRTFNLRKGILDCNSKCVVYKLQCKTCNSQYIGSTITPFRLRFNNYKSQFRSFLRGNSTPQAHLFAHFSQGDHNGMEDWSFQIIDKSNNTKQLREREAFWQFKLDTFAPRGLNERNVNT